MIYKPYDYQSYCIDKIIDIPNIGLFLDMGLGKTSITLTAIFRLKYYMLSINKVLIIAPKKVAQSTWISEKNKWEHTKMLDISLVMGTLTQRVKALHKKADIYVINRDNVTWLVDYLKHDFDFDMVVIDESTSFKSSKSKRFKSLVLVRNRIKRLVELTGTPAPNKIEDLWAQVYLLDGGERLEKYISHFREKYMLPDKRGYGGTIYNYKPKDDGVNTVLSKISDICISMKSEDYLQLPDITYVTNKVVLDTGAMKKYLDFERDMVLKLDNAEEIDAASAAALSVKLLQLSNGAIYDEVGEYHEIHDCKIDAFIELVEALNGKPLLVFYNFKHDLDRLIKVVKSMKLRYAVLRTTVEEEQWNNRELDILLAHPASSAYGLNLQHGGNYICWFGLTWNYELYAQANKRLHRQGQTDKVVIYHLVSENTRDEDVMQALEMKGNTQEFVINSLKARIKKIKDENLRKTKKS